MTTVALCALAGAGVLALAGVGLVLLAGYLALRDEKRWQQRCRRDAEQYAVAAAEAVLRAHAREQR